MICDNCKKRESVISFTKVENNEVTEIHLCKECAAKKFKGNFLMIDGFKDLFKEKNYFLWHLMMVESKSLQM